MTSGLVPLAAPIADEHLGAWASTFVQIASVSAQLARTPFVPASLRVMDKGRYDEGATAANVAAAILTGQELGMEPMSALRSINVINATPALSALALRALLQRYGHQIWLVEATNSRAIVAGLRAGEPESHTQSVTWTMDDAKSRSLAGRPNWRSQPRNMLIARATSEVARLIAADAVLGIPYTIEELEDGDQDGAPPPAEEDTKSPPARKTARRRTAQVAQNGGPTPASIEAPKQEDDEPPLEDAVGPHVDEPAGGHMVGYMDEPPFDDGPPPITKGQIQALQAGFRMLGIDRAERLKIVRQRVERPDDAPRVESAKDLSSAEAALVLDYLSLLNATEAPAEDEPAVD